MVIQRRNSIKQKINSGTFEYKILFFVFQVFFLSEFKDKNSYLKCKLSNINVIK